MQGNRCRAESKAAYQTSGRWNKRCRRNLVHCAFLRLVELPVRRHRRPTDGDAAVSARRRASPLLRRPIPLRLRQESVESKPCPKRTLRRLARGKRARHPRTGTQYQLSTRHRGRSRTGSGDQALRMCLLTVAGSTRTAEIASPTCEPGSKPTEKHKPRQVHDTQCHSSDDPETAISVLGTGMKQYLAHRHILVDMRADPGSQQGRDDCHPPAVSPYRILEISLSHRASTLTGLLGLRLILVVMIAWCELTVDSIRRTPWANHNSCRRRTGHSSISSVACW